MNRRAFLATGTIALAGVLTGCGKAKRRTAGVPADNELNIAMTTNDLLPGIESRVGFVNRVGLKNFAPQTIAVSILDSDQKEIAKVPATLHNDTSGGAPYTTINYKFEKKGTYFVRAKTEKGTTSGPVNVLDTSDTSIVELKVPKPGEKMVSVDSPTTSDARGVNPICTRNPVCPLHDATISVDLNNHKPLVVLFATPALCQSSTCGPVLEVLLSQKDAFPNIQFLHEEIYVDNSGTTTTPTVNAYNLQSEPVLFAANRDGTIATRFDGLFGQAELKAALQQLT